MAACWPGLEAVATHPDATDLMAAIVGAAGVLPTLAAVRRTANPAGQQGGAGGVGRAVHGCGEASGADPADRQRAQRGISMPATRVRGWPGQGSASADPVDRFGWPFRNRPLAELRDVTPAQACAHPNWGWGAKSRSVLTMMNKGLEVIGARWLFDARPDCIQVVVHPQSVIHSMVQYVDGSVLAQLGNPDMYPGSPALAAAAAQLCGCAEPIRDRAAGFRAAGPGAVSVPAVRVRGGDGERLPRGEYGERGGSGTRFLSGDLAFTAIAEVVERTLDSVEHGAADSLDDLLAVDEHARGIAEQQLRRARSDRRMDGILFKNPAMHRCRGPAGRGPRSRAFWVARRFGVKVAEFSIGFGRARRQSAPDQLE